MLSLDNSQWNELQAAYGSANEILGLLKRLYANPTDDEALNDLWSSLCHQGTIYSASIPAVPHLVISVVNSTLEDRMGPLLLAGAIAESLGRPTETLQGDSDFDEYCSKAVELLTDTIKYGNLVDDDLRYSLSALAAFLKDSKLSSLLANADGVLECPKCGEEIEYFASESSVG